MTEDKRTLVHQFISRAPVDEVLGTVWWDGEKICADNDLLFNMMRDRTLFGLTMADGPRYLRKLPSMFNNGYMTVRRLDADE